MPAPMLTVAIPTCNGAKHLSETLDSILNQRDVSFDLIVSDDRSDDETLALVDRRAGIAARVSINETRLGLAGNWNRCVELCQTPLIAIVHQDDVLCPGHLASHVRQFHDVERLGLVASASTVIDEHGRAVSPTIVSVGGLGETDQTFPAGTLTESFAGGNPLRCSAVSIRVDAHRDVGGFDPTLRYVLDWDFWQRVASRWAVAWLAAPTVKVRWHVDSETHRFKIGRDDLDETRRLLDRILEEAHPGLVETRQLHKRNRRRLARAFLNRAHDAMNAGRIDLARECLSEAMGLDPQTVLTILADPRIALRLSALCLPGDLARRLLTRPG